MGKKKSKAGKQKQAKAKALTQKRKKVGSKFNIPISKDGAIIETKQIPVNNNKSTSANTKNQTTRTGKSNSNSTPNKSKAFKKIKGGTPKPNLDVSKKGTVPKKRDEDFEREYRSLEERQYHAMYMSGGRGKSKSKKRNMQSQLQFTPATLNLDQKPTTEQLVADAATHLGGMNELGGTHNNNGGQNEDMNYNHMSLGTSMGMNMEMSEQNNPNLLQVMAAQIRHEKYMQQQYVNTNTSTNANTNASSEGGKMGIENKFWALQDDSDDEKDQAPTAPMFNFAAPSFSLPSSSFSGPSSSTTIAVGSAPNVGGGGFNIHNDDDPDL